MFSKILKLVGVNKRLKLIYLFVLTILTSLVESFSIGAIFPLLSILSDDKFLNTLKNNPIIGVYLLERSENNIVFIICLIFVLASIFAGFLRLALLWYQVNLGNSMGSEISSEIYERTLFQPYIVHVTRNNSEVISGILNKSNLVVHQVILPVLYLFSSLFLLFSIVITLFILDPKTSMYLFLGIGSIYLTVVLIVKSTLKKTSVIISRDTNFVVQSIQEGLGGIRDILLDGTQLIYARIYAKADVRLRKAQSNVQVIGTSPRFIMEALGMSFLAVLAYYSNTQGDLGKNFIPILGALGLGTQRLLPIVQQIYYSWSTIRSAREPLNDVVNLLSQKKQDHKSNIKLSFEKYLELNNVSFSYNNFNALDNINLTIYKGSAIGIIGTTGSGKSTLLDLIMGLLSPTKGKVIVDGEFLDEKSLHLWRSKIAHVPQFIYLADTSIAENIAFGVPKDKIDYQLINECIKAAALEDLIIELPNGLDTKVGERGVRFSGGQRQRIGIARALYKKSEVIVLDEATSALDSKTEKIIMNSINRLGHKRTLIIVAHRISTLRGCECVYEMEKGAIVRKKTYAELIVERKNEE